MDLSEGQIVNSTYKLIRKIGAGTFGDIYLAIHTKTEQLVAVKFEKQQQTDDSQLKQEAKFLVYLKEGVGFPNVFWYGKFNNCNVLVSDNLGPNLEHLFNKCNRKFSTITICQIAFQLITRIEYLHDKNIIHRDLKPENFCIGLKQKSDQIYLIDLGVSKKYRDPRTQMHIPFCQNQQLCGSTRYSSVSAHFGIEQSRRDDLESIGYILIYFLRGELPWQSQFIENDDKTQSERLESIRNIKLNTYAQELLQNITCAETFINYMYYVQNLKFEEKPDYNYLKNTFFDLYYKTCFESKMNWVFDWAIHDH